MTNEQPTTDSPSPVTVLGLGPMGHALASAFLHGGYPTTVWNRTAAKADPLVEAGARRADSIDDAVAASPLVVICVLDNAAARAVLEPATDSLPGRTLVNLTAGSPAHARETANWATGLGIPYVDGAIMTPAATIGGPDAVVLYSGTPDVYEAHEATLASLGGTASHLGSDPGRAAAHEVALLDAFWTSMSGVVHAFALAREENVPATALAPYAQGIVGLLPDIISQFASEVDAGHYPGEQSNLRSAAAGMEHILRVSESQGLESGVLRAARAVAQRAVDAGHGNEGFSRLVPLLRDGDVTAAPADATARTSTT